MSRLISWHGLFHLHIRYTRRLTFHTLKEKCNSTEELLRCLPSEEIIVEVVSKDKSIFRDCITQNEIETCISKKKSWCRNIDNVLCMEESRNGLTLLVKPKSPSVFHTAHYHRSRVFVIIQFCHTRLAWIVCIISSCGQCEAICCKITSILPAGGSLTVCPDCLCSLIIHSLGHHTLSCTQGFRFRALREALCLSCPWNFLFWWHWLACFHIYYSA